MSRKGKKQVSKMGHASTRYGTYVGYNRSIFFETLSKKGKDRSVVVLACVRARRASGHGGAGKNNDPKEEVPRCE